eukprot:15293578-Alexandrium_andersonii.AAC.1
MGVRALVQVHHKAATSHGVFASHGGGDRGDPAARLLANRDPRRRPGPHIPAAPWRREDADARPERAE